MDRATPAPQWGTFLSRVLDRLVIGLGISRQLCFIFCVFSWFVPPLPAACGCSVRGGVCSGILCRVRPSQGWSLPRPGGATKGGRAPGPWRSSEQSATACVRAVRVGVLRTAAGAARCVSSGFQVAEYFYRVRNDLGGGRGARGRDFEGRLARGEKNQGRA